MTPCNTEPQLTKPGDEKAEGVRLYSICRVSALIRSKMLKRKITERVTIKESDQTNWSKGPNTEGFLHEQ